MKQKILVTTLSLVAMALSAAPAFASLPVSAISSMSLKMYGLYTSADPTCQTGLTATIPLSLTAQPINFAASPTIGSGPVSDTINCTIIVVQNALSSAWAAGTYTGTSNGNADSICNAGGSETDQSICGDGNNPLTLTWPAKITTDAAAIGLSLPTSCSHSEHTSIIPIILSTDSVCTGQKETDAAITACAPNGGNGPNAFVAPTAVGDYAHGIKLTAPAVAGDFRFVVNPSGAYGGDNNGGPVCGNLSPPSFSFVAQ